MYNPIDYMKLSHAILAYRGMGFKEVEVPWIVEPSTSKLTTPPDTTPFVVFRDRGIEPTDLDHIGMLIGSAEQGLLQIYDQLNDNTKYVAASPCFRDEKDYVPGLTQLQFFKVELFCKAPAQPEPMVRELLVNAKMLMGTWERKLVEVVTEEGYDLHINGIEVGSYGYRSCEGKSWVYGTGLALPRFDYARDQIGKT